MKLKSRLYVTLLCISMVPLVLCTITMLYQNSRNLESVVSENLKGVSQSQIDNIENFFEQVKQNMEILSNYTFLQDEVLASLNGAVTSYSYAKDYMEDILMERKSYQPYMLSMVVVDRNLRIVATSEDYNAGGSNSLNEVREEYLDGAFHVGNLYNRKGAEGEIKAVQAYQGIYFKGELIGYIIEELQANYFAKYHQDNVFWESCVMQIQDGVGNIVTVGGAGEQKEDFLARQELHDRAVSKQKWAAGYEKGGFIDYKISGVHYFTNYAVLKYSDWTVRVTADLHSYLDSGQTYVVLAIAILAVGVLLMMVLNRYITKKTVKPIEEIRAILQRVQNTQDYALRLNPAIDDEMGELQHEINHLLQCVMELQMREKAEQKSLEKKAEKDPMTGIMNKKAIAARVQEMITEIGIKDGKIAVGFVDIDDFRNYNTLYGHAEGDHVIKFVANTLREMIPGSVGRNGGDEFVFSLETDGREFVAQTMELLMRRLHKGVVNEVTGERMSIPCSIGIVVERAGKTDYRELIQAADEAMYQAKGNGKNTYYIMMK